MYIYNIQLYKQINRPATSSTLRHYKFHVFFVLVLISHLQEEASISHVHIFLDVQSACRNAIILFSLFFMLKCQVNGQPLPSHIISPFATQFIVFLKVYFLLLLCMRES